ncbi:MAG TPA: PadR family transcriptional regulator [Symbiobacteriaceae bacterium]|jgi:DNA-binding PadR family transcriptional regulator|nr:PadR family transcriptional regulator [Symbiobacteriaceae bacterium]
MDERALLLLGLLKAQSQHGYQLNEFIEKNLSRVTDMKKATAYAVLDRLKAAGLIAETMEQEGNRPPRKVYAITGDGDAEFERLLVETLTAADRLVLPGDIGLMFLDHLPREQALPCLEQRLAILEERLAAHAQTPQHGHGIGVDLAVEHVQVLMRADRDWLRGVVERLRRA